MSLQSFCSSQVPLLLQERHLRSWTESSSSSVIFLDFCTFGVLVNTSMPSFTGYTHAATSERAPLTSTMHMRHAPIWLMSFKKQRVGMSIPASLAASRIVLPAGTSQAMPLILMFTISIVYTLLPYFFSIAPNLHFSRQTPHLMHFCVSMTCGWRTAPEIAPTGQLRAQSVQPLHFSASMT